MDWFFRYDNNLMALAFTAVVAPYLLRRLDRRDLRGRLFLALVGANFAVLGAETLQGWLNEAHDPGWRSAQAVVGVLQYGFGLLVPWLWFCLVTVWAPETRLRPLVWVRATLVLPALLLVAIVTSPWTGWVFSVDPSYHRGPGYYVIVAVDYAYLLVASALAFSYRRRVGTEEVQGLLFFSFVPMAAGLVQTFEPGLKVIWSSTAYALIVVFLLLQQRLVQTDPLTGAWIRDKFVRHVDEARGRAEAGALVFIDLDGFKEINDRWGHAEGDRALKEAANLLRAGLRQGDLMARYGGDEFVLFLGDSGPVEVEAVLERLDAGFAERNLRTDKPYLLAFSRGWQAYGGDTPGTVEELLAQADERMYEQKRHRRTPPS